ncbi:MAG: hypothetical protein LBH06_01670, partial [Rikenellaceae bacterium]|nr:hypothetical protein [Rikenellaceae bacterium]
MVSDNGVEINGVVWATRNVGVPHGFASLSQRWRGCCYRWNDATAWNWDGSSPNSISPAGQTWLSVAEISNASTWDAANDPCPQGWLIPSTTEASDLLTLPRKWSNCSGYLGYWVGANSATAAETA